jgi:hypothetical protein
MIDRSFRDNREWSIQVKEAAGRTDLQGLHLSDVVREYNIGSIDLLKIDIEGAEKYLFEDPRAAAGFLSRTKVMAIEIHDEEVDRQQIYSVLRDNGFSYFEFSDLTIAYKE